MIPVLGPFRESVRHEKEPTRRHCAMRGSHIRDPNRRWSGRRGNLARLRLRRLHLHAAVALGVDFRLRAEQKYLRRIIYPQQ